MNVLKFKIGTAQASSTKPNQQQNPPRPSATGTRIRSAHTPLTAGAGAVVAKAAPVVDFRRRQDAGKAKPQNIPNPALAGPFLHRQGTSAPSLNKSQNGETS